MLKEFGRLTKLTIVSDTSTFEVMFNPETYTERFSTIYKTKNTANSGVEKYDYVKSVPQDFKLKMIIDNTGVTDYQVPFIPSISKITDSVYDKVNSFLTLAWMPTNGKPNDLEIQWGKFSFHCWLKDVNINYTLFDRDGNPIRAELDASFIGNTEKNEKNYEKRFRSSISLDSVPGPATSSDVAGSSSTTTGQTGTGSSGGSQNGIVVSVS